MEDEQVVTEENTEVETEVVETEELETEETEEVIDEPSEEDEEEARKKKQEDHAWAEKRIQLKREKLARETAERELEQLKAQMAQNNVAPAPAEKRRDPNMPVMEKFDDVEDYLEARDTYVSRNTANQNRYDGLIKTHNERYDKYELDNDSFADDMSLSTSEKPNQLVANEILNSDKGPQIQHQLANDEKLARRLNRLDPSSLVREIVKLEGMAKPTSAPSNAPAPIGKTKSVTPKGSKKINPDDSQVDYNKRMSHYRATGEWI